MKSLLIFAAKEWLLRFCKKLFLMRIISDAKADGYIAIESFPVIRSERYELDCAGPVLLYDKAGFVKVAEEKDFIVMRKDLR